MLIIHGLNEKVFFNMFDRNKLWFIIKSSFFGISMRWYLKNISTNTFIWTQKAVLIKFFMKSREANDCYNTKLDTEVVLLSGAMQ